METDLLEELMVSDIDDREDEYIMVTRLKKKKKKKEEEEEEEEDDRGRNRINPMTDTTDNTWTLVMNPGSTSSSY
jgi:hypothetical protein